MSISKFVSVRPMLSRGGNPTPNQLIMSDPYGETFVSYGTKIAFRSITNKVVLDKNYWDYSRTTGKYRNEFLGMGVEDCRKGIKDGSIQLVDLNEKS